MTSVALSEGCFSWVATGTPACLLLCWYLFPARPVSVWSHYQDPTAVTKPFLLGPNFHLFLVLIQNSYLVVGQTAARDKRETSEESETSFPITENGPVSSKGAGQWEGESSSCGCCSENTWMCVPPHPTAPHPCIFRGSAASHHLVPALPALTLASKPCSSLESCDSVTSFLSGCMAPFTL